MNRITGSVAEILLILFLLLAILYLLGIHVRVG